MTERHPDNAPGDWYIDTNCIDCGASTIVAPGLVVHAAGQCVFARQPETTEDVTMAWRARLLCPTASIKTERPMKAPKDAFPQALTAGIYRLGYNARSSWGAHSFLIRRPEGNAMVDSPRWAGPVVAQLEKWGGLAHILLTHRDDVADAERYAEKFGARVWIYKADRSAAPYAKEIISGRDAVIIDDDLMVIPLPGHTEGSVSYLYKGHYLFTGDSLSWREEAGGLRASRDVCWWSWPDQLKSLRRLLDYPFDWIFAGHGAEHHLPTAEMHRQLVALLDRLEAEI